MSLAFGIDIGATGIKAGIVNTQTVSLHSERLRLLTPKPSNPENVCNTINEILDHFDWSGPVGIGFPSRIVNGTCMMISNIGEEWYKLNLVETFSKALNRTCYVANDADVAGLAEYRYNKDLHQYEKVLLLTLGTGVGSVLYYKGILIPNLELGHVKWGKDIIEKYFSNNTRKEKDLSWRTWGSRLNEALHHYDLVLSPDAIVLGGGVSKKFSQYKQYFDMDIPVIPAQLKNAAGVIGAALLTEVGQQ